MISGPIAALLLAASPLPCGVPALRDGPHPWRPGEALAWDVDVMGVVKAGSLSAAVQRPASRTADVPIEVRVKNTSVFAKVRRIRGVATSWVDPRTLKPQRYRDETDEDGLRRTTDVRLDGRGPVVEMAWTIGSSKGVKRHPRGGEVLDLVSVVYYLRAAELRPGERFCFDLVANRRYWRLEGARVAGSEPVETPAGRFDAFRVDATLSRQPTPDDPSVRSRPLHLWFGEDARRLPLAAVTEVDLGPVRVLLSRGAGRD